MRKELPESGTPWETLRQEMIASKGGDIDWKSGKTAVYVFHPGQEVLDVVHEAYVLFICENGLGMRAFPSLKQMEEDLINMGLSLHQAPETAAGSLTSGGTESIIMALKACRDWSATHRPVEGTPEIVAPQSVHPAFNKGAQLLGLKVVRTPLKEDLSGDVDQMARQITPQTIMIVGSAPCFPFGVIDPISDLSELALERGLWLHVDACVGGYIAPFVRDIGLDVPIYDFTLPGVRSISADLHKFGYAAKGASTILYADKSYHEPQIFTFSDWPCGTMVTPTMAGTRPGGAIAAAWAVMHFLGRQGYRTRAHAIVDTRQRLEEGVKRLGLEVWGNPLLSIICFGSRELDILAAGNEIYRRGWMSGRTVEPPGINLMLSPEHTKIADAYLKDLGEAIEISRTGEKPGEARDVTYA
jgi:glutamate/tyrosine decarboxylase-like PLP-dependent enzyme